MLRKIPILAAAFALLAAFAADADACNRCGLFGNRCRFAHPAHHVKYVQPVHHVQHVHQEPDVTNFVFNNVFPVSALADQGLSAYGQPVSFARYASAVRFDPNLAIDQANRHLELAHDLFGQGKDAHTQFATTFSAVDAEINRQQTNAQVALATLEANSNPAGGSIQSYRVTVQGADLKVEKIDVGEIPAGDPPVGPPPEQGGVPVNLAACVNCHNGGDEAATKKIRIDPLVAITKDERKQMILAVNSGRMPPKSALTAEQKAELLAEFCNLPSK